MRLVIQRVTEASVKRVADGELVGQIDKGLVVLVGIDRYDEWKDAEYCIKKILNIKLWGGDRGGDETSPAWSRSVQDMGYEVLLISQFTLFGSVKKGNKPDFHNAMKSTTSKEFFDKFVAETKKIYGKVQTGEFGSYMDVQIHNDGPVTIFIDSRVAAAAGNCSNNCASN